MKRIFSIVLALLLLCTCFCVCVNAAEEKSVIYDLSPVNGEIPFGAGKVSDCYYPNPTGSNPYGRPEIYTYENSKVEVQDGFFKLIPTSNNATLFFDTAPSGYDITKWGTDKYLSFVIKSEKATTGEVILRTHSNKFQISFPVEFTGEWQRIVANVSKDAGWMTKDDAGKYTVPTECDHAGVLKFYLPGQKNTGYYLLDYYGYFSNISSAKSHTEKISDAKTTVLGENNYEEPSEVAPDTQSPSVDTEAIPVWTPSAGHRALFYEIAPVGGQIPFGKGRVNDCYFPNPDGTNPYGRPEVYTFTSGTLEVKKGYTHFTPSGATGTITLDTPPDGYNLSTAWKNVTKKYMSIMLCAEKAYDGEIALRTLSGKHRLTMPVSFTGKWQKIIIDISPDAGWFEKDASGSYTIPIEINSAGCHKIDLPGKDKCGGFYIDYIGFFTSTADAEEYSRTAVEGTRPGVAVQTPTYERLEWQQSADGEVKFYELGPVDGEIPFGKGRVGDCYFPNPQGTNPYGRTELYTFNTANITPFDGVFAKVTPKNSGTCSLVLDTPPAGYNLATEWGDCEKYLSFMIYSPRKFDGTVRLASLSGTKCLDTPVSFTGKWQRVVINVSSNAGWLEKDSDGNFTIPTTYNCAGVVKLILPGNKYTTSYMIDYYGYFTNKADAESCVRYVNEGDSPEAGELLEEKEMESVTFYKEIVGDARIFELRPPYGTEIPYGAAKYANEMAYYPTSMGLLRPEIYTWGSATLEMDGDFVKFSPISGGESRMTFDSVPRACWLDFEKPYFTIAVKTAKAFDGFIRFKDLGGIYIKEFPVSFTGEWQKIILNLADPNGWTKKDASGKYQPAYETPFCAEIGRIAGGFYMYLPGKLSTENYTFDYIASFSTLDNAKAFKGIADVKSTFASEAEAKHTILAAKTRKSLYFMNGYNDGTFRPNQGMTRAEACTVVARLMETETNIAEYRATKFTDINSGDWYYNYISLLDNFGFLNAFGTEFKPNQPITRSEFVKIAFEAGAFGEGSTSVTTSFSDVSSATPFAAEITAASSIKAVNGYADGTFRPDNTITRAEITTILCRILEIPERPEKTQIFSDFSPEHWAYGTVMSVVNTANTEEGAKIVAEVDTLAMQKKEAILNTATSVTVTGTKYYMSSSGNDNADGLTPETAWRTIEKLNSVSLKEGDGVFFKRGDVFRVAADSRMFVSNGVTYSAYGEGKKPEIYGSPENGADPAKWTLYNAEKNIWRYERKMIDQGGLIFNDGESFAVKVLAHYDSSTGKFLDLKTRADFDIANSLGNHTIFCETLTAPGNYPSIGTTKGYLYLRCDEGNPGDVFKSIEFMPATHIATAKEEDYNFRNVLWDNICMKYGGAHALHAISGNDFTVQNCEFGWIGGGVQGYTWRNSAGDPIRYGNAVEVGYGIKYTVKNCYIYQCYDAGVTFQATSVDCIDTDVDFSDNLFENCQYPIEYWLDTPSKDPQKAYIENFRISGNIMRMTGFGFCEQRPDPITAAHIKGWTKYNYVRNKSYIIENNIFDRSKYMMLHIGLTHTHLGDSTPVMRNNTYIQYVSENNNGASFGIYNTSITAYPYNDNVINVMKSEGIEDTKVYFVKYPSNVK